MRKALTLCLTLLLAACAVAPGGNQLSSVDAADDASSPPAELVPSHSVLLAEWAEGARRLEIRPIDPATGEIATGVPPLVFDGQARYLPTTLMSENGARLAVVTGNGPMCESYAGGSACRARADAAHFVDLLAWRAVTATLPGTGWAWPISFSPDGARLALAYHTPSATRLLVYDAGSGQLAAQRELGVRPEVLAFAADGSRLAIYGAPLAVEPGLSRPEPPRALWLDAATADLLWDMPLDGVLSGDWCEDNCAAPHGEQFFAHWRPAVVLSHDGARLYIVHADEDRLTTVDLVERTVRSMPIRTANAWLESLLAATADVAEAKGPTVGAYLDAALSQDGARLFVVGRRLTASLGENDQWRSEDEALGLRVVDVKSGRQLARLESGATRVRLAPLGAYVLLDDWGRAWTEAVDANTLESAGRLDHWEVVGARRLDGQLVSLGLDAQSGRPAMVGHLTLPAMEVSDLWFLDENLSDWRAFLR